VGVAIWQPRGIWGFIRDTFHFELLPVGYRVIGAGVRDQGRAGISPWRGLRPTKSTPPIEDAGLTVVKSRHRGAFSRIVQCPLEIPRLVAPPVGAHRARIVAPLRGRVARRAAPAALRTVVRATLISRAERREPREGAERRIDRSQSDRRPTRAERPNDRNTEIRRPTAIEHHAATTAKSATAPPNVALDQAAPVAMIDRRDDRRRVTAERRAARTPALGTRGRLP